jgi:hypothetical protein
MKELLVKPARFHQLVQAFGAELKRWPPRERAAAQRLMEADSGARAAWIEAARLDALLVENAALPFRSDKEEEIITRLCRDVMDAIPARPKPCPTVAANASQVPTWTQVAGVSAGFAALSLGAWVGWTEVGRWIDSPSGLLSSLQLSPIMGWVL